MSKDIIDGSMRSHTNNINKTNFIPTEIINLILLFYFSFQFNTETYGKGLKFSEDG